VGQAEVEDDEVDVAARRVVERLAAGPDHERRVARGAQALGDERGDALRVLDDEDLAHAASSGSARGAGRRGIATTTRAPVPDSGASTCARPPWAAAIAATIGRPRPEPSTPRPLVPRANRSKTRSASSGGTPGPSSVTLRSSVPSRA